LAVFQHELLLLSCLQRLWRVLLLLLLWLLLLLFLRLQAAQVQAGHQTMWGASAMCWKTRQWPTAGTT
jgi:hypothetical protein